MSMQDQISYAADPSQALPALAAAEPGPDDITDAPALQRRLLRMLAHIRPMRALGVRKKRYGRDWDGGYVLLETIERTPIIYSLGISDDVSWDTVMADHGAEIFMYDHTIPGCPGEHPRFHFHPIGISSSDDADPNLRRLDTLVIGNGHGHRTDLALKIDIEMHEWDCFDTIDPNVLARFDQIVCEFHHTSMFGKESWLQRAERVFAKLHDHFQVVHVHANNNAGVNFVAGVTMPEIFELTFANRTAYQFQPTDETFPTSLDRPCTPRHPDIRLGQFVF